MGVVWRELGYVFRIHSRDHQPPHVHVFKGSGEAKVFLNPVAITDIDGLRAKQVKKILEIVADRQADLLVEWGRIHGKAKKA